MTASPKAHGMDGTLVFPDWPPLTLDEVRALLDMNVNAELGMAIYTGRLSLDELAKLAA